MHVHKGSGIERGGIWSMICVHEFTAKGGLHDKSNDYFRTPYNQTFIVQRADSYIPDQLLLA